VAFAVRGMVEGVGREAGVRRVIEGSVGGGM
jgi:hypothetical protein